MKKSLMTVNTFLYFLLFSVDLYSRGLMWGGNLQFAFKQNWDMIEYYRDFFSSYYYFWPILSLLLYVVSLWFKRDADIMSEKAFWIMGACTFPLYAWLCVSGIVHYHAEGSFFIRDYIAYYYDIVALVLVTPIFINLVICAIATGRERRALNKRLDEATS